MSLRPSAKSLLLTPLAAAACILITGCANMVTTASPVSTFSASAEITGKLHGGNQPISGSDVRLYAAGVTGYGSAPTLYAVTTSAADGFGSFSFTKTAGAGTGTTRVYGCPTDGTDPQMYITARGGATQGVGNGNNIAAVFIVALGKCSTIGAGTFVDLNEITTVATMAALQQYFAPGNATSDNLNHLGMPASAQAQAGFANAVSLIGNLANVGAGTVNASSTVTSSASGTALSVTVTPENRENRHPGQHNCRLRQHHQQCFHQLRNVVHQRHRSHVFGHQPACTQLQHGHGHPAGALLHARQPHVRQRDEHQ